MPDAEIKEQIHNVEAFSEGTLGSANVSGLKDGTQSVFSEPVLNYFVELSKTYAEMAKKYALQANIGMLWIELNFDGWVLENNRYKYVIDNLLTITGIFKGNGEDKVKVICDYTITNNKTIIYSYNAFEGYVLGTCAIINEEDPINTLKDALEILSLMQNEEIIDITNQ